MKTLTRLAAPMALGLALAGCHQTPRTGFVLARDYGRVADCYAAFMSVSMDAGDPDLALDPGLRHLEDEVTIQGVDRLTPFTVKAIRQAGGNKVFIQLVAAWRQRKENNIQAAPGLDEKKAIFQHVLLQAAQCHATLTAWGVPINPPRQNPSAT